MKILIRTVHPVIRSRVPDSVILAGPLVRLILLESLLSHLKDLAKARNSCTRIDRRLDRNYKLAYQLAVIAFRQLLLR
jgi:hypothetical protein